MANEFLGLNSINVLKSYIDKQVAYVLGAVPISIITAYAYSTEKLTIPPTGGQITENNTIEYPKGWTNLNNIEGDLDKGAIYMSACEFVNGIPSDNGWSRPIRITPIDYSQSTKIDYNDFSANRLITEFISKNYFVTNLSDDSVYVIDGSEFDDKSNDIVCKFTNIGDGTLTLRFENTEIINNAQSSVELKSNESVEVLRINQSFVIVGKK